MQSYTIKIGCNKVLLTCIIFLGFCITGFAEQSSAMTSKMLLEDCQIYIKINADKDTSNFYDSVSIAKASICNGYLNGFNEATYLYMSVLNKQLPYCIPKTVHIYDIATTLVNFIKQNPSSTKEDNLVPAVVVFGALSNAYPCKAQND